MEKPITKIKVKAPHVHPELVNKEVWEQRNLKVDERCHEHAKDINALCKRQENIERKITATLVFAICSLAAILIAIITNLL